MQATVAPATSLFISNLEECKITCLPIRLRPESRVYRSTYLYLYVVWLISNVGGAGK